MSLVTETQARVPAQVLAELSNARDSTATTADSTLLAQAASSIQTRFQMYAQETYSDSNNYHVELCVHGVVALMRLWGAGDWASAKEFWEWFKGECEAYRNVGPRARISPATNSPLKPSNEDWDSSRRYPWSDDREFYDIIPRQGGALDDLDNS